MSGDCKTKVMDDLVVDHLEKQLFHLDNFIWHKMIND